MALGETCCFYANQSWVIMENLAMVRENLKKRKKGDIYQIIDLSLLFT